MIFGSLFTGIGGLDLGLERAGWRCAFQVEVDPWCRSVLSRHWPDVPKWGDIRDVRGSMLPHVDALVGGFPCQDVSIAGTGRGLDGDRSGLWREFDRLIGEMRPKLVLIENVAALLHRGLDRVVRDLAARGYVGEWDVVSAAAIGAPHLRERVWIVAWDPARLPVPHTDRERVWVERERLGEQRGEPGAPTACDDGAARSMAHGDHGRREDDGAGLDIDRGQPRGGDASRCGPPVADAVRDGDGGDPQGPRVRAEPSRDHRIHTPERVSESRARFERETWPRHGTQPEVGRAPDGLPAGLGPEPWERGTDRSVCTSAHEADAMKLELQALGNAVVPANAEHMGRAINAWMGL